MLKLKVHDTVKVMAGKDKGREGKIEKVLPKEGTIVIPGVNMYKKHVKGLSGDEKGGIYDVTRPLNASKVALVCPKCSKTARIGYKFVAGSKKRICKKCGREIDTESKAKKK